VCSDDLNPYSHNVDQGFPKCGARTPGGARAASRGCARGKM